MAVALSVDDVLAKEFLVEGSGWVGVHVVDDSVLEQVFVEVVLDGLSAFLLVFSVSFAAMRMTLHVRVDYEGGKLIIDFLLDLIADDSQDVETRQNWVCQVNIIVEVH